MISDATARAIYQITYGRHGLAGLLRDTRLVEMQPPRPGRWHDSGVTLLTKLRRGAHGAPLVAVFAAVAVAILVPGCGGGGTPSAPALVDGEPASVQAATNPVAVSPLPGTRDASAASQISFLGGPGTNISHVRVIGSASGVHSGVLRAYSTGTGESFLPTRPFVPRERVVVHALVGRGGATRAAGTTFTVADPAAVSQAEFPSEGGDPSAVQHFISAPSLSPSTVTIATPAGPGATPGSLFLAPYQGDGAP